MTRLFGLGLRWRLAIISNHVFLLLTSTVHRPGDGRVEGCEVRSANQLSTPQLSLQCLTCCTGPLYTAAAGK